MPYTKIFIAFVILLSVSACGIKPKTLSAPDANKPDLFPQTYPYDRNVDRP
jgi:predicted small lipoprotein YifL